MAKKNEAAEGQAEGSLVQAAKKIGETAGKIASALGVAKPAKPKVQKLVKKNKSRLPRKQKKAARKNIKSA